MRWRSPTDLPVTSSIDGNPRIDCTSAPIYVDEKGCTWTKECDLAPSFADTFVARLLSHAVAGAAHAQGPAPCAPGMTGPLPARFVDILLYKGMGRVADAALDGAGWAINKSYVYVTDCMRTRFYPTTADRADAMGKLTRRDIHRMVTRTVCEDHGHYILIPVHRCSDALWDAIEADGFGVTIENVGDEVGVRIGWSVQDRQKAKELKRSGKSARPAMSGYPLSASPTALKKAS